VRPEAAVCDTRFVASPQLLGYCDAVTEGRGPVVAFGRRRARRFCMMLAAEHWLRNLGAPPHGQGTTARPACLWCSDPRRNETPSCSSVAPRGLSGPV